MYIHRIEFSYAGKQAPDDLPDMAMLYLSALRMNGQVCGAEWPLYLEGDKCVAIVLTLDADSLDARFGGQYVKKSIEKVAQEGVSISPRLIAEDFGSGPSCNCANSSSYALYTTYVRIGSPIKCLDCFSDVPLYRFPAMNNGEYHEAICWQSDYQSCDRLQMNCAVLEKSATNQLSELGSSLSKKGRKVCKDLAALTGKPFYYYLYRYNGKDLTSEKERRCPSCGEPWLLDEPQHDIFDFRCDRCRLLSNIAWDVRYEA